MEDIDDLCNEEVQISITGRLYSDSLESPIFFTNIHHLHIDTTDKAPILGDLKVVLSKRNEIQDIINSLLEFFKVTKIEDIPSYCGTIRTKQGQTVEVTYSKILENRQQVKGTLCVDADWNSGEQKCNYVRENNCSFCLFMKGGECRKAFQAWEKCVEKAKEEEEAGGNSFVDMCADQTISLKNCVDAHPDYYYAVLDQDETRNEEKNK